MILLDTNVLSELIREHPEAVLCNWVASLPASSIFTSSITQAEMLLGVALLPAGKRKAGLFEAVSELFEVDFCDRVLSFDGSAAQAFAQIVAERRKLGKPISHADAQIAAIARSRGATVATRNTDDFEHCGVEVLDPWH
jgi:toxin FitB